MSAAFCWVSHPRYTKCCVRLFLCIFFCADTKICLADSVLNCLNFFSGITNSPRILHDIFSPFDIYLQVDIVLA